MNASYNLNRNHYIIDGDSQTPKVVLDKKRNIFEFSGNSLPENALHFYTPIIEWFELYKKTPNKKTKVVFKLNYINSATSKMMHIIIIKLNEIYLLNNQIEIEWHYHISDDDMLKDGKIFLEDMSLPYKFINYT